MFDTDFFCSILSSPKHTCDTFLFQIRLEGSEWSFPFPMDKEKLTNITVRHTDGRRQSVRLDVRGYENGSRFIATFQLGSSRGPYRYMEILLPKPCTFLFRSYVNTVLDHVRCLRMPDVCKLTLYYTMNRSN